MDLEELKRNIASLQREVSSVNYLIPKRKVIFYDFLTDSNITNMNEVCHAFLPLNGVIKFAAQNRYILVIHNHEPTRSCTTPDFCHEYGWEPNDNHHPGFRKAFWLKNAIYYPRHGMGRNVSPDNLSVHTKTGGLDSGWDFSISSSKE